MICKLGLDINIDKISWSILDKNNDIKSCGSFVIDISSEDKEDFLRGEKIGSYNLKHRVKKRRNQYQSYKNRRDRLIKRLVELEFCDYNILLKKLDRKSIFELREKAQRIEISKEEFALICIHFNKNRGYFHNRILDYSSVLNFIEKQDMELFNSKKTLSKFLLDKLNENSNSSIKEYIFTRQRHKEDFDIIFQTQIKHKNSFTPSLWIELRDRIIFYQKDFQFSNQKYNDCPFEKFHKNTHISNPFFLDFMIWKQLNKLIIYDKKGTEYILDISTKNKLFDFIKNKKEVTGIEILKELENIGDLQDSNEWLINKDIVKGNFLRFELEKILDQYKINSEKIIELTQLDYKNRHLDTQPLFDIWHSIYSIYDIKGLEKKLINKYSLSLEVVKKITEIRLNEKIHFGYLSTKACRKLILEMQDGFMYSMACKKLGYFNYDKIKLSRSIRKEIPLYRVVLNRTEVLLKKLKKIYNYNEVNILIDKNLTIPKEMRKNRIEYIINLREHKKYNIQLLKKEYSADYISGKDLEKYKLWKEVDGYDFISKQKIEIKNLFSDSYQIEDILGRDDSFFYSNKVLVNKNFIGNKPFFQKVQDKQYYINYFNENIKNNINTEKYLKYLGVDMNLNFKKLSFFEERLKILVGKYSEKLNIIDFLEVIKTFKLGDYNFVNILKNIEYKKFKESGQENLLDHYSNLKGEKLERLSIWRKVQDIRYFILKSIIVNSLTDIKIDSLDILRKQIQTKMYEVIIFNEKKDNIVFSKYNNPTKQLHRDIFYGKIKRKLKAEISIKLNPETIYRICNIQLKDFIIKRLKQYEFNFKKAFSKKELDKNPLIFENKKIEYFYFWDEIFVTKKEINKYLPFEKIVDKNLKENFIKFINTNGKNSLKKGIFINGKKLNSIRVEDISKDLHNLKNKAFVYLRDNHHISIFKDKNDYLFATKTTYWNALLKKRQGINCITNFYNDDTIFILSLRINDYFLFTDRIINFSDFSFENRKYISDNLFRVQKLTIKSSGQPYFWFRHHKENTINNDNFFSVKIVSSLNNLKGYKLEIDIFGNIKNNIKI